MTNVAFSIRPQLNVTVEHGGQVVFGDTEVRLLEAIAARGTLSDVASTLGLSYRSIWGKIREVEARLGTKLVLSTVGGSRGGSTQLTPAAQRLIELYGHFRSTVGAYAEQEFEPCSTWLRDGCCEQPITNSTTANSLGGVS
jgi:molybdate transport system regulatory protein